MANLTKCKCCDGPISDDAPSCVHCGQPGEISGKLPSTQLSNSLYVLSFLEFFAGIFVGAAMNLPAAACVIIFSAGTANAILLWCLGEVIQSLKEIAYNTRQAI